MKTSFISSYTLANNQRSIAAQIQKDLSKNTTEATTGRYADVGLELGNRAGKPVALRAESTKLEALIDSNDIVLSSMSVAQLGLQALREGADVFKDSLLSVPGQNRDASVLVDEAEMALATFYGAMNGTDGSRYLFAGLNSDVAPIVEYDAAVGADGVSPGPQALVDTAFASYMAGLAPPVTDTADLTAAQMQSFLDNEFAALFDDTNWSQTWSTATNEGRTNQISPTERATTSLSANEDPFRQILMAYTMVAKLDTANLNTDALETVMAQAEKVIVAAYSNVSDLEARLGNVESRVAAASNQMDLKVDVIAEQIDIYEGVDAAEAKTRIDMLTTQLEMSYSLTNRLLTLSILDYA